MRSRFAQGACSLVAALVCTTGSGCWKAEYDSAQRKIEVLEELQGWYARYGEKKTELDLRVADARRLTNILKRLEQVLGTGEESAKFLRARHGLRELISEISSHDSTRGTHEADPLEDLIRLGFALETKMDAADQIINEVVIRASVYFKKHSPPQRGDRFPRDRNIAPEYEAKKRRAEEAIRASCQREETIRIDVFAYTCDLGEIGPRLSEARARNTVSWAKALIESEPGCKADRVVLTGFPMGEVPLIEDDRVPEGDRERFRAKNRVADIYVYRRPAPGL